MSTSDKSVQKNLLWHLGSTLFLALAGAVYERFSHEVYSYYMIYAFAFPLVMGVVPYTVLLLRGACPDRRFRQLWNSSVAAFSVGSFFAGVLAIAGYTNSLIVVYPIAGVVLAAAALGSLFVRPGRGPEVKEAGHDDTVV